MRRTSLLIAVVIVLANAGAVVAAEETGGAYGAWDLTLETRQGPRPSWVKLFQENDQAVAEFVGVAGGKNRASDVQVDGDQVKWTMGADVYEGKLTEDGLTGELVRRDRRTSFTGQRVDRKTDLTGTWDVELDLGGQTMQRTLNLEQDGGKITGSYRGADLPQRDIQEASLAGDQLTYSIEVELGGQGPITVNYELSAKGDRLEGVAVVKGAGFEADVTGARQRQWAEPVQLFNGADLSNWDYQQVRGDNQWKVVDGVMVNDQAGWNILTKQKFKDYKLSLEFKVPEDGNSGVYLNGRYEVQVADSHGQAANAGSVGAIYGRAVPTANPSKPAGEWQKLEIHFVDYWATVALNGTTIIDNVLIEGITGGALDSNESEPGPLMLQGDHGHIEYRNIVLTPLAE